MSVMMDQGGPPPGGLPPELLALLQGGAGMGVGAAGSAAGAPLEPDDDDQALNEGDRLDRMLSDALILADGDLSEQNKLAIQQVMTLVQKIKAGEEKDSEQMLQGKLSPSMMRRASQTANGGY